MSASIFMCHTKKDYDFCNAFGAIAASEGIRVFRSEFEAIEAPAWKTIKKEIEASSAMFLLVGKELVRAQKESEFSKKAKSRWKYTQNWIAYEIGLACAKGIDVWVSCDGVKINFPVPYLNNYTIREWNLREKKKPEWIKWIFKEYDKGNSFPLGKWKEIIATCPSCKAQFNFHSKVEVGGRVACPTCLKEIVFEKGWLLTKSQ